MSPAIADTPTACVYSSATNSTAASASNTSAVELTPGSETDQGFSQLSTESRGSRLRRRRDGAIRVDRQLQMFAMHVRPGQHWLWSAQNQPPTWQHDPTPLLVLHASPFTLLHVHAPPQ